MQYAAHSFGSYSSMLLLVIQCILHLLVFTRCSLVFDEGTQEARKNKYCFQVSRCLPGTHVMCQFGDKKMGPRCDAGKQLPFHKEEVTLTLDFLNEFKRKLSRGQEKNFPRAYGMIKLSWDNTLAEFAQTWANQCIGHSADRCRDSEKFPRTWQIQTRRFFNLNWSLEDVQFKDNAPRLTMEKRRKAIEFLFNGIYQLKPPNPARREIENYPGGKKYYLQAVHGPGSNIGCGMSSFIEYRRNKDHDPLIYNTLLIVCNFSHDPKEGEKVYETKWVDGVDWTPCGCPKGYVEDDCLCVKGYRETGDKPKEVDDTQKEDNNKGNQKGDNSNEKQKGDNSKGNQKGDNSNEKQKGDDSKGNQKGDNSNEKQKGDNSKGKQKGTYSEDDLIPRLIIMPIFTVKNANENRLQMHESKKKSATVAQQRRNQWLRQGIKESVQKIRERYFKDPDPGTRLPHRGPVDEDIFILSKNGLNHTTYTTLKELKNVKSNKKKSNIEIKPRRDFSDLDDLVSEYLLNLHNDAGLNSSSDMTYRPINNMRGSIGLQANIKHSKKKNSENLKKGFNDIYNSKQKFRKIASNKNFNEMFNRKAKENTADNFNNLQSLQSSKRQMLKGDLIDKIHFADYDIQEHIWPKRNQNPINSHRYDTNNFDYNVPIENDQGYRNYDPQSMFVLDDYNVFGNDQKFLYDEQNAPFSYDANEVAQFYLDRLNAGQGRKLDTSPGHRLYSDIETKYRLDTGTETRHTMDPDITTGHRLKHKCPIHPKRKSSKSRHHHHCARMDDHKQYFYAPDRLLLLPALRNLKKIPGSSDISIKRKKWDTL